MTGRVGRPPLAREGKRITVIVNRDDHDLLKRLFPSLKMSEIVRRVLAARAAQLRETLQEETTDE